MSAWPIPDEVVRALAETWWNSFHDPDDRPEAFKQHLANARDFLERHRLVVLPEGHGVVRLVEAPPFEPSWDLDDDLDRIPGQPITVGEEERDGDE